MTVAVYPLGLSTGATLGIRGSIEQLPTIRVAFDGEGAPGDYALTGARAYDVGAGLYIAVMHSGVTLAPAVGLFAADEILAGRRDPLLAPYGPARFA